VIKIAKKKACKKCKMFVEGSKCKSCHSESLTTSWQGRIYVTDVAKSMVAGKIDLKVKGEYAIKVR
jgi:DNA-directed RNA polymerase subunit E"